jgi:hypothetical protein
MVQLTNVAGPFYRSTPAINPQPTKMSQSAAKAAIQQCGIGRRPGFRLAEPCSYCGSRPFMHFYKRKHWAICVISQTLWRFGDTVSACKMDTQ